MLHLFQYGPSTFVIRLCAYLSRLPVRCTSGDPPPPPPRDMAACWATSAADQLGTLESPMAVATNLAWSRGWVVALLPVPLLVRNCLRQLMHQNSKSSGRPFLSFIVQLRPPLSRGLVPFSHRINCLRQTRTCLMDQYWRIRKSRRTSSIRPASWTLPLWTSCGPRAFCASGPSLPASTLRFCFVFFRSHAVSSFGRHPPGVFCHPCRVP